MKFFFRDLHVVLDLTPNYVTAADKDLQNALKEDPEALSAFVTTKTQNVNNWKKVGGSGTAWKTEGKTFFLSQFGENYDLQMSSPFAQNKLLGVINHLAGMGVKGFRLNNAKFLVINQALKDEVVNSESHKNKDDYEFYRHGETVYQPELSEIIHKFSRAVYNATDGEGFLTIRDDVGVRAEVFASNHSTILGFDLPRFVFLNHFLKPSESEIPKKLHNGFEHLKGLIDISTIWMQVVYKPDQFKVDDGLDASAYNMFMSLLPGVQIVPFGALNYAENKTDIIKKLEEARESQVFQHGKFNHLLSVNDTAFGYTR